MTKQQAIWTLIDCRRLLINGLVLVQVEEITEAFDMAIEALNNVMDSENDAVKTEDDVIKRQDAIECCSCLHPEDCWAEIKALPSAEPKIGRDCTDFVNWLLEEVMDEEMWELNAVAIGEVIARKLKKLGLLEVKDGYYVRTPSADRPSGEWKYLYGSIGSYMTISCPFCGVTFNNVAEWEYNYCPSCGARMKGGDDE